MFMFLTPKKKFWLINWHCYVQCKHTFSDGIAYLQITVSLYIALKMVQWIALLQIFHTEKCLDLSGQGGERNTLLELGPCLDCELGEKNGIIVTTTSGIKFGFCPSLQLILVCDMHSVVLWNTQKLLP